MDDFHSPQPHAAPLKSTVSAVLTHVSQLGNSLLSFLAVLLAAVMALYSGYMLYESYYTQGLASSTAFDLLQYRPEIVEDGMTPLSGKELLSAVNEDYRAWLTVYDSNIDYPVVQGEEDLYYASHDVYGEISLTGSIYLAADNSADFSDSYNLIYGHHMDNGAMFGALDRFLSEDYFRNHREGVIVSASGVYNLRTFAVVTTDAYEGSIYTVGNRMDSVLNFLREKAASPDGTTAVHFLDENTLTGAEKIVALSTCAGAETNGRLIVFATMTRRNMLTLQAEGYNAPYDGESHGPSLVKVNYPQGTVFSYSTDGGVSWIEGLPLIREVSTITVLLRADHEIYGTASQAVTLRVTPRPIVIRVQDQFKVFGEDDPAWEVAPITGIVDGFTPVYTLQRTNAGVEDVGLYEDVLVAKGAVRQGNYLITYLPGDFQITPADTLALLADGYTGIYDAAAHGLSRLELNIAQDTLVEYSLDGGRTWTTEAPAITHVGTLQVLVRASNPSYEPVTASVELRINPAPVYVTARDAEKHFGETDPRFDADISGVLDNARILFDVTRPGAGTDESIGRYEDAIVPAGAEYQGDYQVFYRPADFTILPSSEEIIDDTEAPRTHFFDRFTPKPGPGTPAWALVNLICLMVTAYFFLPLLHLRAKFGRIKRMRRVNAVKSKLRTAQNLNEEQLRERDRIYAAAIEAGKSDGESIGIADVTQEAFDNAVEAMYYHMSKFVKSFRIGICLETLDVIAAIIAFVLTEDMRLPMILIDKWTPLMVLLMLLCWIADLRLLRYRDKVRAEEELEKEEVAEILH